MCALGLFPVLLAWAALSGSVMAGETRELTLAVYSVPKEAYERTIIPAFQRHWKQRTGQEVRIRS
ncbi:MAG: sulfate ABC transporter substrate-binding protein, partial [Nitrospirota bacterium]|nr:sulfate ABC transporter substrate-binding protein [Nitrospirota bacterium]